MTKIQWVRNKDGTSGKTWNPIVGCHRVSSGCVNCYAERQVHRGLAPQHKGLTVLGKNGPRWNGKYNIAAKRLDEPLRRKMPTAYFANSLSDLFYERLPFELIAAIYGVMAACPQHTFQVLTKRPEHAADFFLWLEGMAQFRKGVSDKVCTLDEARAAVLIDAAMKYAEHRDLTLRLLDFEWPLRNVWLGVSVEDQATADQRILALLDCPAAVRWVSYEPALGPVDFTPWLTVIPGHPARPALDWLVVGGESGPGARPFDLGWARSVLAQVGRYRESIRPAVFVKQLGAQPYQLEHAAHRSNGPIHASTFPERVDLRYRDRKGADMDEWPEELRCREYPR